MYLTHKTHCGLTTTGNFSKYGVRHVVGNVSKVTLASLAAMGATAAQDTAIAAEASNTEAKGNPLTVTVVGGLAMSKFSDDNQLQQASDYGVLKLGIENGTDMGGFGSISMGRAFDEGSAFDWRVTGSVTEFLANDRSDSYTYAGYGYNLSAHDDADWQHLDFEIGRTLATGNLDLRIGAGVRMTNLEASTGGGYGRDIFVYSQSVHVDETNSFTGGGPRASIEGRFGGTVGVEFAGSIAAIYSNQKQDLSVGFDFQYYDVDLTYLGVEASQDDWNWLTNIEASAGLSLRPSESVDISAGYRYERISNVDTQLSGDSLDASGPYLKIKAKF
jgi:opacity protein-like surface antigen